MCNSKRLNRILTKKSFNGIHAKDPSGKDVFVKANFFLQRIDIYWWLNGHMNINWTLHSWNVVVILANKFEKQTNFWKKRFFRVFSQLTNTHTARDYSSELIPNIALFRSRWKSATLNIFFLLHFRKKISLERYCEMFLKIRSNDEKMWSTVNFILKAEKKSGKNETKPDLMKGE